VERYMDGEWEKVLKGSGFGLIEMLFEYYLG
jgi:hypothetical protein